VQALQAVRGKSRMVFGWPRRRPRRMPDREASRERARILATSAAAPPQVRAKFTLCENAVMTVIAGEHKRHGVCDLAVGKIAALAGVCATTVRNAVAEGVRCGLLQREERERPGRPNDTNIIRIVSAEWLGWIKRGPGGYKFYNASKIKDKKQEEASPSSSSSSCGPRVFRILSG
jgi:hypothetical protein